MVPSGSVTLYLQSMELHLVDDSGQPVDVSLAADGVTLGVLAGVLCSLIGEFTVPSASLVAAPLLAAAGVWMLSRRDSIRHHLPR